MVELEFTKKSMKDLCPIALKLATILCEGSEAINVDENTHVVVPQEVIERTRENAGNPGTIEEIMEYLRVDPWASRWAEGMCEVAVGRDSPYFDDCVNRMLRKLAEEIQSRVAKKE